ncbi:MAG: glucose 1-dehydrogenase [Terracidiphilus sp.]|jgi:3-oxoacyl-[acyl-carrier protein] reductase
MSSIQGQNLQGKVALVTGASKGIGAAIARELAARGAAVAVNYSGSKAAAEKLVAEITIKGGKAVAIQANLADPDSIQPLIDAVATQLGPIDVLVNNAGIYEFGPLEAITPEHFHKQFNVNVLGLLLVTQAAVPRFNPAGGSIINIGSVVGRMAFPNGSVYSATKGAVDSITVSLSKELGTKKIRVNALNPGMIETEGAHDAGFIGSDFEKTTAAETPLGRIGQPHDVATAAAFLASTDSGWLSGQTIYASGGFTR